VRRRGDDDLRPVAILLRTSRQTRGASRCPSAPTNACTACGSRLASSRRAQDIALTTMSSRSSSSRVQTASVRFASPAVDIAPRDFEFRGTVATSAARRLHRSRDRAYFATSRSRMRPNRQATPATKHPKQSTSLQLVMPFAKCLTSAKVAADSAPGRTLSNSYANCLSAGAKVFRASARKCASLRPRCCCASVRATARVDIVLLFRIFKVVCRLFSITPRRRD
jgi:hypothetical protein